MSLTIVAVAVLSTLYSVFSSASGGICAAVICRARNGGGLGERSRSAGALVTGIRDCRGHSHSCSGWSGRGRRSGCGSRQDSDQLGTNDCAVNFEATASASLQVARTAFDVGNCSTARGG